MKKSLICILALMAFALLAFTAAAQETYVIDKVIVNGVEIDGDKAQVYIGQEVEVVVELKAGENLTEARDAKVIVEISGLEHNDIRESTGMFPVSPGNVRYRKALNFELPTDMEAGIYTLYVMVTDGIGKVEKQFQLYIEPTRHLVDIVGVSVTPQPYVEAGETATVRVRLENVGAMTEENVEVVAAIDALGVTDRDWVDLVPSEIIGDDEEKSETVELSLPIPKDAKTGEYELAVGIAYDDGYETLIVTTKFNIKGVEKEEAAEAEDGDEPVEEEKSPVDPAKALVITFDTTSQTVKVGKETAYKVTVSNLGSEARTVSLNAAGAQLFADIRIDPTFMEIEGGQKADAYVYAKAQNDAELKTHIFTLRVLDDDKLYKEVQLSLGVEEAVPEKPGSIFDEDMLKIGFIALVVILIIVGLLIAFRRVRGSDYPLEPIEERTYY